MAFYEIDTDYVGGQLTPPKLRKDKQLSWVKVLLINLFLFNNIFKKYREGSNDPGYNVLSNYSLNDTVVWTDKSVYIYSNSVASTGNLPSDSNYWTLLQNVFIGSNERVKYNSQKLLFEYALNKFFMVSALPAPQIYITNNFINAGNNFLMNTSSVQSSVMPLNSLYQGDYMGLFPTYTTNTNDYTIFVPVVVYTALGTNVLNREFAIRRFADIYNLSGMRYSVVSY